MFSPILILLPIWQCFATFTYSCAHFSFELLFSSFWLLLFPFRHLFPFTVCSCFYFHSVSATSTNLSKIIQHSTFTLHFCKICYFCHPEKFWCLKKYLKTNTIFQSQNDCIKQWGCFFFKPLRMNLVPRKLFGNSLACLLPVLTLCCFFCKV